MPQFLHGYRTYLIAALMAALGVLEQTDWFVIWDDPKAGWTAVGSALIMAILRSVTTTPPGPRAKAPEPSPTDEGAP
jgi:hypothetical protein